MSKKYNYDIHLKCYFYDCAKCNVKVCHYLINDTLCLNCNTEYKKDIEQMKKDNNITEERYLYLSGDEAKQMEIKMNDFNIKVLELNKKYNI